MPNQVDGVLLHTMSIPFGYHHLGLHLSHGDRVNLNKLGKYEVLAELGHGAMGVVY
jgi:hypothetical protein